MAEHYKQKKEADWGTPGRVARAAREFMGGIDLDPCSSEFRNKTIQASKIFTVADADPEIGIPVEWGNARRIFINPPGGKFRKTSYAELFWRSLKIQTQEMNAGAFIWIAYNVNQLQTLQQVNADLLRVCCLCVPDKRVQYLDKTGTPKRDTPSASAILGFAWGEHQSEQALHWAMRFRQCFAGMGAVWQP